MFSVEAIRCTQRLTASKQKQTYIGGKLMSNKSVTKKRKKSNSEIFTNARAGFYFSFESLKTASLFVDAVPLNILFGKTQYDKKIRHHFINMCIGMRKDVDNLKKSIIDMQSSLQLRNLKKRGRSNRKLWFRR